jgi:hypothetical protein
MERTPPIKPTQKWTLETALKQLEFCNFEAKGGSLEWSDAFIWLKNIHPQKMERLKSQRDELLAACKAWVEFQALYEKNTNGDTFPGNDYYNKIAMEIVDQTEAAIAAVEGK